MNIYKNFSRVVIVSMLLLLQYSPVSADPIRLDRIDQVQETCDLDNGQLTIFVEGDTTGLLYSIDAGVTYSRSNHFTDLPSADYLIVVSDGQACSEIFTAQIARAPLPTLSLGAECIENMNRLEIIPDVENGILPYSYSWSGPNSTSFTEPILTGVIPGEYSLTITDALGCTFSDTVMIEACCVLELTCDLPESIVNCVNATPDPDPIFADASADNERIKMSLSEIGIDIANDACGNIAVSVTDISNNPTDCTQDTLITIREYSISDNHNTISCFQEFKVLDFVQMSLDQASDDMIVQCGPDNKILFDAWIARNGGLQFTACSDPVTISTLPAMPVLDDSCSSITEVTFIVEDGCGNTVVSTASFKVEDQQVPELDCPSDIEVNIDDPELMMVLDVWAQEATANDNCGIPKMINDLDATQLSADCDTDPNYPVVFTATDDCGLISVCTAVISVIGPSSSVLSCGDDLLLDCSDDKDTRILEWLDNFVALDDEGNSGLVDSDIDVTEAIALECGGFLDVYFTHTDDCDRIQDCTKRITVRDNTRPDLVCPDDLEITVTEQDATSIVEVWSTEAVANDDCSIPEIEHDFVTDLSNLCDITDPIPVTFTTKDDCDNTAECISSIFIISTIPSLSCPAPLVINCGQGDIENMIAEWAGDATAADNSDNPITNDIPAIISEGGCNVVTDIIFTTLDNCGTEATCNSTITFKDEENPVISCPQEITLDIFSGDLKKSVDSWLESASATDCNSATVTDDFIIDYENLGCSDNYLVTFVAEDACGLTSNCSSTITLENNASIEAECPQAITLECSDPALESKILDHINQIEVSSQNDYEATYDYDTALLETDCINPVVVEITISTEDICNNMSACQTSVTIIPDPAIYIPNVFTPDNDGLNDWFTVYGNESIAMVSELVIFNRWGSKVFETRDILPNEEEMGWTGRYNDSHETNHVFTYYAIILDTFGNEIKKVGTIQILK